MSSPRLPLGLCAALLALLLTGARGQNMHELLLQIGEKQANQEALLGQADPSAALKEVQDSLGELEKLWTHYLPELVEGNGAGLNLQPLTPACNKSASAILNIHHGRVNFSWPQLKFLLDASGKPGPGILDGNLLMHGAFDECLNHDFTSYCLGKIHLSSQPFSSPYAVTVGLCVPKYCTEADVGVFVDATQALYVTDLDFGCMDQKTPDYSPGAIVMLVVCALFGVLVLAGSVVDKVVEFVKERQEVPQYVQIADNGSENGRDAAINSSALSSGLSSGLSGAALSGEEKIPLLTQSTRQQGAGHNSSGGGSTRVNPLDFLTAFSLYKTVPTLLATKQAPGVITSLNGLRVMSMFWVILGHTFVAVMSNVDNPFLLFYTVAGRFTFQAVGNGYFSVDSFFFLSGTLVAYLTLRQTEKKKGRFPFLHYYLHRYLRLTPIYAFVLFFTWTLTIHLAPAPVFNIMNPAAPTCSKYWWTNLLYINNLYPWKLGDECIAWTWYLANDMQFYVISPLILLPLYYLAPVGMAIAGALLFSSFVVTAVLSGVYQFPGNPMATIAYHFVPPNDKVYQDLIYVKPWGRISPYIVGLLLGYLLYKNFKMPFRNRVLKMLAYLALWACSAVLLVTSLYGLYFTWHGHIPSAAENVIYNTFSRFAWGLGLALLVFACHNGYGGVINTFLSSKIWTPLSRMTYNAYMVHLVVMTVIYSQLQTSLHYTDITIACYTVAFVVISYAVAAVLCVTVEFPLGTIEMLLFKLVGLGGRETQRQVGVAATATDTQNINTSEQRGEGAGDRGVA